MGADLATEDRVLGDHDLSEICSGKGVGNDVVKNGCLVLKLERLFVWRQLQAAAVQRERPGCVIGY